MFESLFAELKLQNTDRTNAYIAKVEVYTQTVRRREFSRLPIHSGFNAGK